MRRHGFRRTVSAFGVRPSFSLRVSAFGFLAVALHPCPLLACAACYGQSDSPMAKGMNWGILSLLVVVVVVLGAFAAFFIYVARRSAAVQALPQAVRLMESTHSMS